MAQVPLPDGSVVNVRPGETGQQAWERARHMYPEAFGIQQQHGFTGALRSGMAGGVGAAARGIGALAGSPGLEQWGKEYAAPSTEPGAWRPTTSEDVSAKFKEGILPGIGAWKSQHITEPLGGMIGRYAIPTAVGAGAAALAPEAGVFGLGAMGLRALAHGAGFVAADAPMEQGENLARQEEVNQGLAAQGQVPRQFGQSNTIMASLAQAALLPVFGHLGGMATKYLKLMGPDLAQTATLVRSGQLTKDAAVASLNSTAKNLLVKTGEAAAVGAPMMVGTEALRTAQSGEAITGPEAMGRYGENLKAAAAFAPIGGVLGGARVRAAQIKPLEAAGKERDIAEATQAREKALAAQSAAKTEQLAQLPRDGAQLGLDIPGQPATGQAQSVAEAATEVKQELSRLYTLKRAQEAIKDKDAAKQTDAEIKQKVKALNEIERARIKGKVPEVEPPPSAVLALTTRDFDSAGIPKGKAGAQLRAFAGRDLADPTVQAELRAVLETHLNPETAPKWVTDDIAAKMEQSLGVQGEIKGLPTWEASQAALPKGTRDMFSGDVSAPKTSEVEPPTTPSAGTPAQRAALEQMTLDAISQWNNKKISDTKLREILTQARLQQGRQLPLSERPAYETKTTEQPTAARPTDTGKGDGVPVLGEAGRGVGRAGPDTGVVGAGAKTPLRAAKRKEPIEPTLTLEEKRQAQADRARVKREAAKNEATVKRAGKTKPSIAEDIARIPKVEKAKPIGPDDALTEGPTGIGKAARATTLEELAPTQFRVTDKASTGEYKALWWNDLAQIVEGLNSKKPSERKLAQEAKKVGLARKTFTKEQMAEAVRINKANVEKQRELASAIERREALRVAEKKALDRAARKPVKETEKIADEVAALKDKEVAEAATIDQLAREESARSAEEGVDADVARMERELTRIAQQAKPDAKIKVKTGEGKRATVNLEDTVASLKALGKNLDVTKKALEACARKKAK